MAVQTLQEGVATLGGLTFGASGDSFLSARGGQTVNDSTCDQSALTDLANWTIGPESAVNFGGGGNNVKFKSTGVVAHAGSGLFIGEAYQGGAASTWARLKLLMQPGGEFRGRNGTFTTVEQRSGKSNFNGSSVLPDVWVGGGEFSADFITGTSGFQTARFEGGVIRSERGLDTNYSGSVMDISGGARVHIARSNLTNAITGSPSTTTIPMGTGSASSGIIRVQGHNSYLSWQGYTIDTLIVLGGAKVDFSGAPVSLTVGTLYTDALSRDVSLWQSKVPGVTITYSSKRIFGCNDDTLPG